MSMLLVMCMHMSFAALNSFCIYVLATKGN